MVSLLSGGPRKGSDVYASDSTPSTVAESTVSFALGGRRLLDADVLCPDVPRQQAAPAALGTLAKFASAYGKPGQTVAIQPRVRRFMLQAGARDLLPDERVAFCLRRPIPGVASVDVLHSPAQQSAHYGGLMVCANLWACPVCAVKASERRREELSGGIAAWDGQIIMVTLTLQHTASDDPVTLVDDLQEGKRRLCSGRGYQSFKRVHGVAGTVVALECTYNFGNGFHPHQHILFFVSGLVNVDCFAEELRTMWPSAVAKVGRYASPQWGIHVTAASEDVAAYVAKWGREPKWTPSHEMAKASSKRGRGDSFSMWGLLENYTVLGDEEAGARFREYVHAFRGRSQLRYSPGLRAVLGLAVEEKTDQEIVEEAVEDAVVLAQLDLVAWRVVLANDVRAELLNVANSGDPELVRSFLLSLGVQLAVVLDDSS